MVDQTRLNKETEDTIRRLRNLPTEISGRGGGPLRRAALRGAQVLRDEAIKNASGFSHPGTFSQGNLAKNIIVIRDRNPKRNGANERYFIVPRARQVAYKNNRLNRRIGRAGQLRLDFGTRFYWIFKEFGTVKQRPEPFLRPAFESKKGEALMVFQDTLRRDVVKLDRKVRR